MLMIDASADVLEELAWADMFGRAGSVLDCKRCDQIEEIFLRAFNNRHITAKVLQRLIMPEVDSDIKSELPVW
jgi:hypothetical protein